MINYYEQNIIRNTVGVKLKEITLDNILQIYRVIDINYGTLEGSGTLIEIRNNIYILTANHVLEDFTGNTFAIFRSQGSSPFKLSNPVQCIEQPIDLAISRVDSSYLEGSLKRPIKINKFAKEIGDLEGDILFIHGFPGEKSRYHAFLKGVLSESVPYTTHLLETEDYDHNIHFAIAYDGEGAIDELDRPAVLPDPHGYSGSLVWVARVRDRKFTEWEPGDAEIVGIAHTWYKNMLICTRVEEIRKFLKQAIHKEMAYFSWLERGCPYGDSQWDWFYVESSVNKIFGE
jgi:hypothetical protein